MDTNTAKPLSSDVSHHKVHRFKVSSSAPNDTQYKLETYLIDSLNFSAMFGINEENTASDLDFPLEVKKEGSQVSGYCSRTSSTASNVSDVSVRRNQNVEVDYIEEKIYNKEVSDNQVKAVKLYFSSLTTSVIVCKTAARVYELDDVYELGLREISSRILNWNYEGEGVLFIQLERRQRKLFKYLCLANPDNCRLKFKIELSKENRLTAIRPSLKYLFSNKRAGLSKVYGLYFADDVLSHEFSHDIHKLLDSMTDSTDVIEERKSSFFHDLKLLNWTKDRKSEKKINNQSFDGKNPSPDYLISNPMNFEFTLHVPFSSYWESDE